MEKLISAIVCTHNPRDEYLDKVLTGLKSQNLSLEQWELLLIDNASNRVLASEIDLSWHPKARHIREEQLGLTPARLRGIQEAKGEIIIFIDDDNVIENDYLEIAWQISQNWPMLGAWGGQCIPGFDEKPPTWTESFWEYLGIKEFDRDRWSNLPQWETTPIGAGMCVRQVVAQKYASLVKEDPQRARLDRQGKSLLSCGDMDLAYTACDMGLGIGIFTSLKLTHLMPPNRLEEKYLLELVERSVYSRVMLNYLRGKLPKKLSFGSKIRLSVPWLMNLKVWFISPRERRFSQADTRGKILAMKEIFSKNQ